MKRIVILLVSLLNSFVVLAQSDAVSVVRLFGENLADWCSTADVGFRKKAQKQCAEECRVIDEIMEDFAKRKGLPNRDFVVPSYLNAFEDMQGLGQVSVLVSNVRLITNEEQTFAFSVGKSDIKKSNKLSKEIATVACDISVMGAMKYNIRDLFYVRKGKIIKITPYEEVIDRKSGRMKVKVDFSDLEETSMLGFTLNYGQHFQVGASVVGQSGLFMCSLDFGFNVDKDKYTTDMMSFTDIMNFERTTTHYDPILSVTATPSLFLKYVSIGCGVGCVFNKMSGEVATGHLSISGDGSSQSVSSGSYGIDDVDVKLVLRPQVKGYISISRSCNMSLGIGYDIVPKMKELNGWEASLGFLFDFDDWDGLFNWF